MIAFRGMKLVPSVTSSLVSTLNLPMLPADRTPGLQIAPKYTGSRQHSAQPARAGGRVDLSLPCSSPCSWPVTGLGVLDEMPKEMCFLLEPSQGSLRRKPVSAPFLPAGRPAKRGRSCLADVRR